MRFAWVALGLLCAACARPVDVTGAPSDPTCASFLASLPVKIAEQTMRETTPSTATAAAWGDPPIIVRCGVAEPRTLVSTSSLIEVESVTWFPEALTNGTLFTSVGRSPRIEVSVPRDYAPEVNVLVDIAAQARAHTERES